MEPDDAAAGVQDVESLLPDGLAELGAALAAKAQRGRVWRWNDDTAKVEQRFLAARNRQRCDVQQGDVRQPVVKKPRLGPEMDETGNRQCVACGTTQTPKWRCGMTLCNACGLDALRYPSTEQHKQNLLCASKRCQFTNRGGARFTHIL